MKIYISVISHGHLDLIKKIGCLKKLSKHFEVIIKANKKEPSIEEFCNDNSIHLLDFKYNLGFGKNNNIVYEYCKKELSMEDDDFFVILNPDVYIEEKEIIKVCQSAYLNNEKLVTINLFKDYEFKNYDNSIRRFPSLFDFISSFIGFKNNSIIDKSLISHRSNVDWAAGSLLIFRSELYQKLKGFDEGYFMYCEDVDICLRSSRAGFPMIYYPEYKAVHLGQHANRKILSRHFYWHCISIIRYLKSKYGLTRPQSSIS